MADAPVVSPTTAAKMYDLFPNTKPANGKYVGVISGLLRNLPPRDVLASASAFHLAGAVHDVEQDAAAVANSNNNNNTNTDNTNTTDTPKSPQAASGRPPLDLLVSLCEDAKKVFDAESVIINVKVEAKDRLVLVGDIHGQFRDLQQHVLSTQRETSDLKEVDGIDCKYLFLGDYVDRGPQGVEVIALLMALKVEYPNNVFMIRGNHEDAQVSRLYGFLTECKNKLEVSSWGQFNEVFNNIPLGATVECEGGNIFCCHGGLSPTVESIAALQFLNRAEYGHGLCEDSGESIDGLLWSDPGEHKGFRRNMRGCGYTFGTDMTAKFCESNGVAFVCRAHQMVMAGYQWEHDHKLLTLFSAPNYCGINHNNGAIAIVMGNEANAKHLEVLRTRAGAENGADSEKAKEELAAVEEESAAATAVGINIPIIYQSFASAPSTPCTLYYTAANGEAQTAEAAGATPDANGSPVTSSLPSLSVAGVGLRVGGDEDDDTPMPSATPRPPADPNLAIDKLKYFVKEEEEGDATKE